MVERQQNRRSASSASSVKRLSMTAICGSLCHFAAISPPELSALTARPGMRSPGSRLKLTSGAAGDRLRAVEIIALRAVVLQLVRQRRLAAAHRRSQAGRKSVRHAAGTTGSCPRSGRSRPAPDRDFSARPACPAPTPAPCDKTPRPPSACPARTARCRDCCAPAQTRAQPTPRAGTPSTASSSLPWSRSAMPSALLVAG